LGYGSRSYRPTAGGHMTMHHAHNHERHDVPRRRTHSPQALSLLPPSLVVCDSCDRGTANTEIVGNILVPLTGATPFTNYLNLIRGQASPTIASVPSSMLPLVALVVCIGAPCEVLYSVIR